MMCVAKAAVNVVTPDRGVMPVTSRVGGVDGGRRCDIKIGTGCFLGTAAEEHLLRPHSFMSRASSRCGRVGEVRAAVGKHGVYLVSHCGGEGAEDVTGSPTARLPVQLDEYEPRSPVSRDKQPIG